MQLCHSVFESLPQLVQLGLKPAQINALLERPTPALPMRVTRVDRGACLVIAYGCKDSPLPFAEARAPDTPDSGATEAFSLSIALDAQCEPIAVGDWLVPRTNGDSGLSVDFVLPRHTWLRRAAISNSSQMQLIASNLDTVFIVTARAESEKLDRRQQNSRRLERFLWLVREGGATPIVLINKSDLSATDEHHTGQLSRRLGGVPVLAVSALEQRGLEALTPYLYQGNSIGMIGPSGVGKSTLINRLLGHDMLDTGEARLSDGKGRHTTTRRELVVTPSGACLIDTPGMREVGLYSEDGQTVGFLDVQELAVGCRFNDCGHEDEPGCAVLAAIARGDLLRDRLDSFHSLARDAERQALRHDAYGRHLANKQLRRFGKVVRVGQRLKGA